MKPLQPHLIFVMKLFGPKDIKLFVKSILLSKQEELKNKIVLMDLNNYTTTDFYPNTKHVDTDYNHFNSISESVFLHRQIKI